MIDPNIVTTIRVGELPSEPFNLTDNLPHEIGTDLKRGTVQQLVDLISSVISVDSSVGFRAVSVTDGQTLPTTTQEEFILVGKGTYYNIAGGDTIVLTEELNALVSNGSFWFVGVEIPINVELAGITQFVRQGFTTTSPSENAVFNAISNLDINEVIEATNFASLPLVGLVGKIYITLNDNLLFRWNGSGYTGLTANISGKEDTANKSSSFTASSTVTYANTKALVDGLATKVTGLGASNNLAKFGDGNIIGNSRIMDNFSTLNGVRIDFTSSTNEKLYLVRNNSATGAEIRASSNGLFDTGATDNANLVSLTGGFTEGTESYGGFKLMLEDSPSKSKIGFFTGGFSGSPTLRATIRNNGNFLVGTETDNGQGIGQFNGTVTASPATLPNQVVVKSQLDLKADLASPALTGTPTAPTATVGTNTTQIATTAFVLANAGSTGSLEFNATDLTVWNNGKGDVATNTSFGDSSLRSNTSSGNNSSYGVNSMFSTTTGGGNSAFGINSMFGNITGTSNSAFGNGAGRFINAGGANTNATSSVFLGLDTRALVDNGTNEIVIGATATGAGSNTATLGNTSITQTILRGTVSAGNATALNHLVTKAQTLYTNQTVTANKTVTIAEFVNNNHLILRVDTTAGNITITLPTFTALAGYKVTVKKIDSSANSVTITGVGGVNIDGAATLVVSGQYGKSTVGSDLVQYIIL
jgi:hypothetical protein